MSSKKANGRRHTAGKNQKTNSVATTIILFCVGLFLFVLSVYPGENIWYALHNILFGIFGITAWFVGPSLMVTGILADRRNKSVGLYLTMALVGFCFACALVQLFMAPQLTAQGLRVFKQVYISGVLKQGGGLMYFVLGWILQKLLGRWGAIAVLLIVLLAIGLIFSGVTLSQFVDNLAKPVQKTKEIVQQQRVDVVKQRNGATQLPTKKPGRRSAIDIDLGPDAPPVEKETPWNEPSVKEQQELFVPAKEESTDIFDVDSGSAATQRAIEGAQKNSQIIAANAHIEPQVSLDDKPAEEAAAQPQTTVQEGDKTPVAVQEDQYRKPPIDLLKKNTSVRQGNNEQECRAIGDKLVKTLASFGVSTKIVHISHGPSVTRYELQPSAGVKVSKIKGLADDIALNLAASGVRIEAPIPNKAAVGIEVPNRESTAVTIRDIIDSKEFRSGKGLTFALGKDIAGEIQVADIAKMPHLLIAGATGSGKSVCINGIILSLLYKYSPEDVRLIMIDPKMVELGKYNGIPHLEVPVVTDPKKAAGTLAWAVSEMLNRYKIFAQQNVRDLGSFNRLVESGQTELQKMPQVVIIIDELADLMMASPKEVEDSICRLAQMARAAGMYLIIATQRPSVDVITGLIKANIPSRLALAVSSQIDSRTILDAAGAEKLLGRGDMLFMPVGNNEPVRIQGCYATDEEIDAVIEYIKVKDVVYNEEADAQIQKLADEMAAGKKGKQQTAGPEGDGSDEDLLDRAVEIALDYGQVSTSFLQRKLKLGYARASRIMDAMDEMGIVGPFEGSKPRKMLINKAQWMERKMAQPDEEE